jgi:hypothetical protein
MHLLWKDAFDPFGGYKCDSEGRYSVGRLIEQHGRDGKLTDRVENQIYEN